MGNPCDFYIDGKKFKKDEFFAYVKRMEASKLNEILGNIPSFKNIPAAPFITETPSYVKLGMKVALKEAVKQGADKIAWTTGEQQNDRYDLSKQVRRIDVEKVEGQKDLFFVDIDMPDGSGINLEVENGIVRDGQFKGQRLEDIVGKDVAEKILTGGNQRLEGEGLKVGGKGMKGFYGSPSEGKLGIVGEVAKSLFKQVPKETELSSANWKEEDGRNILYDSDGLHIGDYSKLRSGDYRAVNMFGKELVTKSEKEAKEFVNNAVNFQKSKQHSITITPELRATVQEGLPMFDMTGKQIAEGKPEDIAKYIQSAKTVLNTLYPNATLEVYDTEAEFIKAGGTKNSRGTADMRKGGKHRIMLNLEAIQRTKSAKTAVHEVIHPIVYDKYGVATRELGETWNNIVRTMRDVKGMEKVFDHARRYHPSQQAAEGITEFLAQVATGGIDINSVPKAKQNAFIELINKIFKALGIDFQIKSPEDFGAFTQKIKDAFNQQNISSLKESIKGNKFNEYLQAAEKLSDIDPEKRKQLEDLLKKKVEAEIKSGKLSQEDAKKIYEKAGIEPPKQEPKVSGIKKALVSDEVVEGVDMERVSDEDMMAMGRKIIESGEVKPRELVEKIITEKQGVLKPAEVVALIYYKADLDKKQRETYTEINKRREAGEDLGTLEVEAKNIEREISDYEVMSVITAQQQSLAFRLRQKLLDQDYNVVTQIEKYKANNDGYIPPEVEEKFKELDKKIKDVKNRLWDVQQMRELKEAQDAVQNIKEEVARELKRAKEVQKEAGTFKEKAKKAADTFRKLKTKPFKFKDKDGNEYDVTKMGFSWNDLVELGARAIEKTGEIADGIKAVFDRIQNAQWYKDLSEKDKTRFFEELEDYYKNETKESPPETISVKKDGSLKIPEKLLKEKVASGITDIEKLTDEVHKEAVKVKPDATKREVRDAITDYGKKVNPTSDTVKIQLNTAKRIGRLLSEVEDLQNKKAKEKNPSTAAKLTKKERELKRQIRSLQKQAGIDTTKHLTDEEKLSAAKERVKNRIAELETRIKNKDFAKPTKKLEATDKELTELNAKKEKLQQEFDDEQYKLELKNRSGWKKAEDIAKELFSGLVRGLVASVDLSAGFVQGFWRVFTNPIKSWNAFGDMFKHLISEKGSQQYLSRLKSAPDYPLMQASKLAIDDKSGKISAREGLFISNWVNLIWDRVISPLLGVGNKKATEFFRRVNPYAASQRAFDGYVNSIRVQSFRQMVKQIEADGHNYESNPKAFEKAADFVNTTTGRGSLGKIDGKSDWLNIFFFAPRKVISEIKLFTPYAFAYYARMPKAVRWKALKNVATFTATYFTVNALLHAALKPDEDDEEEMKIWKDFWNPDSSNFLTHSVGDKRINIGGGMKSMIVFLSRMWGTGFVDQYGNQTELGNRYGKTINTKLDLAWRYVLGKASPAISVIASKLDERKGREMDSSEIIKNLSVPIWMQDLKELYKEDPVTVNAFLTALSIFGANIRVAEDPMVRSSFTAEDKQDPTFKYFLDKGMNLPNVVPASVDVPDKATKTMKNLTDYSEEKIKQYQDEHKIFLKAELKEVKDKGYVYENDYGGISTDYGKKVPKGYHKEKIDDLTKEQLAKILKSAQGTATTKTKEKLFPE